MFPQNTKFLILLIIALLGQKSVFSQSGLAPWEGIWKGVVDIWDSGKKIDSFPMSLEIIPKDSAWDFIILYNRNPDKPDKRAYSLIVIEDSIGHYAIDEHNGIILDCYALDNCIYASFGGLGNDLLSRMCLQGEQLEYEISSALSDPIRISGNTVMEGDTIPEIRSYKVFNLMKAVLTKE